MIFGHGLFPRLLKLILRVKTIKMRRSSLSRKLARPFAAWKAHQLRSINQDRARLKVLEFLDPTCVLIVQDFAMTFTPVQYREDQSDFFGKRGISRHVSVCLRKVSGKLESQTFIHIFQSGLQDSTAVVLQELFSWISRKRLTQLTTTFYFISLNRSDSQRTLLIGSSHISRTENKGRLSEIYSLLLYQ